MSTVDSPGTKTKSTWANSRTVFLLGLMLSATGLISPAIALVGGAAFGFMVAEHPMKLDSSRLSRLLLQASVVLLGFGMNLVQVVRAGRAGFGYTAISITAALGLGWLLGVMFRVRGKASFLISTGTAICGGSAIAAVAPITNASEEEVSVAMGTVFLLNSIALLLFPVIGHLLHLSQTQFGLWAALAIHDTSSVVGASAAYGPVALAIGTTVKLARALWIVPLSLITAAVVRAHAKRGAAGNETVARPALPWFIALFCAAAAISTYLPRFHPLFVQLVHLGQSGLTATLFLIGTGLSKATLRKVGVRPLLQGVVLWLIVGSASLAAIYAGKIAI